MQKPNNRDQIAIKLSGVSKKYTIHHEKPTLVERVAKGRDEEFWVYPGKCEAFIPGAQQRITGNQKRRAERQTYQPRLTRRVGIIGLNGFWGNTTPQSTI